MACGEEDNGEIGALSLDSSYFAASDSEDSFTHSDFERAMTTDYQETPLPKELELRAGSQPLKYTLWSKVELSRGKRFGPIPAQLKDEEPTRFSAWRTLPYDIPVCLETSRALHSYVQQPPTWIAPFAPLSWQQQRLLRDVHFFDVTAKNL
ncbi:uncharacterized protein CDAR_39701 [Caerostris darwini]|uniref:Uncharacterized protein n=1 Tax=Caerostris darwini TaxID=1538125 RepID=A0AAV4U6K6_9ARAC|nr:uncharacterized protein CDAR_39701 [Caerostris darwini]